MSEGPHGSGHDNHGDHDESDCESDCFMGYTFAQAAETDSSGLVPVALSEVESVLAEREREARARHAQSIRPRGPPSSLPISV